VRQYSDRNVFVFVIFVFFVAKKKLEPLCALFTRGSAIAIVAALVVFVAILWATGRPWICKTGIGFWTGAWSHCTSQHLFDPYSLTHVLHGIIFYWLLKRFVPKIELHWRTFIAIVVEIGWELWENSTWVIEHYRQHTVSLDYVGDSVINSTCDVLSTIIGFAFASQVSWKVAVAMFVVIEVGLLLTIRDSLTMNVLMFFLRSEAIKQWQLEIAPVAR
jgi:hypothetical protein